MKCQRLCVGLIGPLPPPWGGMANQTQQLGELLTDEGATVLLIRSNAPCRPAWVQQIRGLRAFWRLAPYVVELWRCAGKADVFHIMANSGWSWHLVAMPAVWLAKLRRVRTVVNYRGGEASTFLARSSRWILPTLKRADVLAVPSGYLRDVFGRFGVDAELLPNIVDLLRFRPGLDPRTRSAEIIVPRNLEPIYDVATAIRAYAIVRRAVPHATLVIAGSGPECGALNALAEELSVAQGVTFTGHLTRDQMADAYRNADVVLNPSLVDNMPNSLLEAMASGVPVVSTSVGGVPYVVRDGVTALLVPPGQSEPMAHAMLRVLQDPELATSLRAAGLAEVQKYAWPNVRERLLALYGPLPDAANAGVAAHVGSE